jgi:hypothetical protein
MNNITTTVIPADMSSSAEVGTNTLENPIVVKNPLDIATTEFNDSLNRRSENRDLLMQWIKNALVDKTDYGSVPTKRGPSKPSLRKPGAEKICGMLGLAVQFPTLDQYERAAVNGTEIKQIILRCELVDSYGCIVASGIGARNISQDYGDLNKALKMAAKSAQIDATLRCAGLSEIFTQDLEDMPPIEGDAPAAEMNETAAANHQADSVKHYTPTITAKQVKRLFAIMKQHGITRPADINHFIDKMKAAYGIEHTDLLSREQYEKVCNESIPAFAQKLNNNKAATPTPPPAQPKPPRERTYYQDLQGQQRYVYNDDDDAYDTLRDADYYKGRRY